MSGLRNAGRPVTFLRRMVDPATGISGTGVKCGSCTACCRTGYEVDLLPSELDRGLDVVNDKNGRPILRRNEDGSCVHLGPDGCTVYEKRPAACRIYDCRAFALAGLYFTDNPTKRKHPALVNDSIRRWKFDLRNRQDIVEAMAYHMVAKSNMLYGLSVEDACARALASFREFVPQVEKRYAAMSDDERRQAVQILTSPALATVLR